MALTATLFAAGFLSQACAGSDPADGTLLVTRPTEGILELDPETGESVVLLPAGPSTFLFDAAASPSGSQIAYAVQPPATVENGTYDSGYDLWVAERDGSGPRRILEHDQPNQLLRYPQWVDEERLIFIQTETIAPRGTAIVLYNLVEYNIASGERRELSDNALSFGLSADRKRVALSELSQSHAGHGLVILDLESGTTSPVEMPPPYFQAIEHPRPSPEGDGIVFAAADPAGQPSLKMVSRFQTAPRAMTLHGAPQDIWTVDPSDAQARVLAQLQEDSPSLAWDGDGSTLYVLAAGGFYSIKDPSGAVSRIGEGAFHGQISWMPPNN